jgi:hypothetical protein
MPDGSPVPRYGPGLRKIAKDAVKFVYNHGAGKPRGQDPYFKNREELGKRFRKKYSSFPLVGEENQGNVQPTFIGSSTRWHHCERQLSAPWSGASHVRGRGRLWPQALHSDGLGFWFVPLGVLLVALLWQLGSLLLDNFKYFSDDPERKLKLWRPTDWPQILKTGHFAAWNKRKTTTSGLDPDVQHARHAMAIDEGDRADFPRVGWASKAAAIETKDREPKWLKQVWFPGCHSGDIGGSYPEAESRLSDIAPSIGWSTN